MIIREMLQELILRHFFGVDSGDQVVKILGMIYLSHQLSS